MHFSNVLTPNFVDADDWHNSRLHETLSTIYGLITYLGIVLMKCFRRIKMFIGRGGIFYRQIHNWFPRRAHAVRIEMHAIGKIDIPTKVTPVLIAEVQKRPCSENRFNNTGAIFSQLAAGYRLILIFLVGCQPLLSCSLLEPKKAFVSTNEFYEDCVSALSESQAGNEQAFDESYCGKSIRLRLNQSKCTNESPATVANRMVAELQIYGKLANKEAQSKPNRIPNDNFIEFMNGPENLAQRLLMQKFYGCKLNLLPSPKPLMLPYGDTQ